MDTRERPESFELSNIFDVIIRGRTYANILYLLLAFPLGLFYFILLIVGFSVGIGTAIVGVGLLIFIVVLAASRGLAAFERHLTSALLGCDLPAPARGSSDHPTFWGQIKQLIRDPLTWKGIAYLLVKFPFGVLAFVVVVVSIALSGTLLLMPFMFPFVPMQVGFSHPWGPFRVGFFPVTTLEQAIICSILGAALLILFMHLMNGLALLWSHFARLTLAATPQAVDRPEAIVIP